MHDRNCSEADKTICHTRHIVLFLLQRQALHKQNMSVFHLTEMQAGMSQVLQGTGEIPLGIQFTEKRDAVLIIRFRSGEVLLTARQIAQEIEDEGDAISIPRLTCKL